MVVRIGKKGITDALLRELDNVLRARNIVKVKLLKNYREAYGAGRSEVARELADKLGARVVEVRGFTILLERKGAQRRRESASYRS